MSVEFRPADERDVKKGANPYMLYIDGCPVIPPTRFKAPSTPTVEHADIPLINGHQPSKLLFRVHDEKSASKLSEMDGFAARHDNYGDEETGLPVIGSQTWRIVYQANYYSEGFLSQEMIQEDIIKHVLGGWPGYTREYTGPSEWISTSSSLDWSIWEIARRLVKLRRPYVELSLIAKNDGYKRNYKGNKMFHEDAAKRIEEYGEKYWLTEDQKMALNFARASSEVACFGRIFKKDIIANTRWTKMVCLLVAFPLF